MLSTVLQFRFNS